MNQEDAARVERNGLGPFHVEVDADNEEHKSAVQKLRALEGHLWWGDYPLRRLHDAGDLPEIAIGLEKDSFVVYLPPPNDDFGTPVPGGMTGFTPSQEVAEEVIKAWGRK